MLIRPTSVAAVICQELSPGLNQCIQSSFPVRGRLRGPLVDNRACGPAAPAAGHAHLTIRLPEGLVSDYRHRANLDGRFFAIWSNYARHGRDSGMAKRRA